MGSITRRCAVLRNAILLQQSAASLRSTRSTAEAGFRNTLAKSCLDIGLFERSGRVTGHGENGRFELDLFISTFADNSITASVLTLTIAQW